MPTPIQLILISAVVVLAITCLRSRLLGRAAPVVVGVAAILLVMFPSAATEIAHHLGVGRGVDLVLYLSLVLIFFLLLRFWILTRQLEHKVTELLRQIALLNAKRLGGGQDEE